MSRSRLPLEIVLRIALGAHYPTRAAFKQTSKWLNLALCSETIRFSSLDYFEILRRITDDPYLAAIKLEQDGITLFWHNQLIELAVSTARPDILRWLSKRDFNRSDLRMSRTNKGWWETELSDLFWNMRCSTTDDDRIKRTVQALVDLMGPRIGRSIKEVFANPDFDHKASDFPVKQWAIEWWLESLQYWASRHVAVIGRCRSSLGI